MTNEKKTEPGVIDEDYDMNAEMEADYQRMGATAFARQYEPPPGLVQYGLIRNKYDTYRRVRHDLQHMTDADFDSRYHEGKEAMRPRLAAWLLMDEPLWNVTMLMQAYRLNPTNLGSDSEIEELMKNAQSVKTLGETFEQGDGIQWLREKGIVPFSEFIGTHPPVDHEVPPIPKLADAPKGLTKSQALAVFAGMLKTNLASAMEDNKAWIADACIEPGRRGKSEGLWNPVLLAIAIQDHHKTPKTKLTQAFYEHTFLAPWREEWLEKSDY